MGIEIYGIKVWFRVNKLTVYVEKMDYSIIETETWELIRLRQAPKGSSSDEYSWRDEYNQYQHYWEYILLKKNRITDNRFEDELCITITPLFRTCDFGVKELYDSRAMWSVYADLYAKQIKFGKHGSFQIPHELRGRGLGSYILSDLVQWVKQYHPTLSIQPLHVKGFDDKQPTDWQRRESLYEGVGFRLEISKSERRSGVAIAEDSSVLHENRNPNKVESINLQEFREILEENSKLHKHKSNLEQALSSSQQEYDSLKTKLFIWRTSTIFLILLTVGLGFIFHS